MLAFRWESFLVSGTPAILFGTVTNHGGNSANPSWLSSWARRRAVVVSERMPAPGKRETSSRPLNEPELHSCAPGNAGLSTFNGLLITSSLKGSWTLTISLDRDP